MNEMVLTDYTAQIQALSEQLDRLRDVLIATDGTADLRAMSTLLNEINNRLTFFMDVGTLITGVATFFVVVAVCYFVYKFFRIFI